MGKKTAATPTPAAADLFAPPAFFLNFRLQTWLVAALALALYANSLTHGFVLDDKMLIIKHELTKQGLAGIPSIFATDLELGAVGDDQSSDVVVGGRYRPVSMAVFAAIYAFAADNPMPYHLVSVLFFALLCAVFYRTTLRFFGKNGPAALLASLAAALFALHPIHTEVVNNVKSLDEILALLCSLAALGFALRAQAEGRQKWVWLAGAMFLIASFSKENTAPFVVLIPLALWLKGREMGETKMSIARICWPIWAAFGVFLAARGAVLGWSLGAPPMNLINNSFVKWATDHWVPLAAGEKWATVAYTLGKYLWLHILPHPLTTDYYPRHIAIHTFAEPMVWAAVLANIALLVYALRGLKRGGAGWQMAVPFGLFFYFSTLFLVSNIPFPVGTNMAERFAFMPSAGICWALAGAFCWLISRKSAQTRLMLGAFGVLGLALAAKTFLRNPDFESNLTLFRADERVSGNSAKMQYGLGGLLLREAMKAPEGMARLGALQEAINHLDRALEIHPAYAEAYYARGSAYFVMKNYFPAIIDFEKSLAFVPNRPEVRNNLAAATLEAAKQLLDRDPARALTLLEYSNRLFPNNAETAQLMQIMQQRAGKTSQ